MAVTWKKLAYADDVIALSLITAKGDILVGTAAGVADNLAIGANTYVLAVATDTPGWVDPATLAVADHATTHKNGGTDELLLNEFGEPTAAVKFDGQQATDLVLETTATPPATPVVGKIYFDTDLSAYVCTSAA